MQWHVAGAWVRLDGCRGSSTQVVSYWGGGEIGVLLVARSWWAVDRGEKKARGFEDEVDVAAVLARGPTCLFVHLSLAFLGSAKAQECALRA